MFSRAIIFVVLFALGPVSGWAQAKVGSTVFPFLNESPSVRANGMGGAGVALVDDYSYYANPGSLALFTRQRRATVNFYPGATDIGGHADFNHQALVSPSISLNGNNTLWLSGAYYRTVVSDPVFNERTYVTTHGDTITSSSTLKDRAHNFVIALGHSGKIAIGTGMTVKAIREEVGVYSATGWAVDLGLLVRHSQGLLLHRGKQSRASLHPVIGLAVGNLGPDIGMLSREHPLPRSLRIGLAVPMVVNSTGHYEQWQVFSFVQTFDWEERKGEDGFAKYGFEAGYREAVYVRLGSCDEENLSTWGFTLSSRGLAKTIVAVFADDSRVAKKDGLLTDRLSVEFTLAEFDYGGRDPRTYRSLSISFGW